MSDAIVVGGGIAGLATAALLSRDGMRVALFEARDQLGGRAGRWERDGFRFDTGPSWYLMPEVFDHFFRMLGTSAGQELDLVPLTPAYRVYAEPGDGGRAPLDVVSGRDQAIALFESVERGAGAHLATYLDSAAEAYDLAVTRFLYDTYQTRRNLLTPTLLRRAHRLLPLLTTSLERFAGRRFRDPVLRQILGYPAVFLGGDPAHVPALYHLMSHLDLADGVRYPQGGFAAVIDAIERLARAAGADIRTGTPIIAIEREDGRAAGVRTADGTRHRAPIVIATTDLHHAETRLLPDEARTYPESWWRRRTPSSGALLVLLGVTGELPQLAHHTLLFTRDWRANFDAVFGDRRRIPDPASLYVCRPSATDPTAAPPGHENLFVLVPVPADPDSGHGGVDGDGDPRVERAADAAIGQISRWAGIPDLAERVVVRRTIAPADFARDLNAWQGNALGLSHTLRQSALFRPANASATTPGLFYAGASALPGIGLPLCLISAELVRKRIRGDLTPGPSPEPAGR
ncbi:MAG: phytoene desaturase family protein [Microbacterium sp.]